MLESAIDKSIESVDESIRACDRARLVGLGGTVTTVAALHLGLDRYQPELVHLAELKASDVNEIYHLLAKMSLDERSRLPCLPKGRADVIVAGASILARTMALWSFESLLVSEKDILDGLIRQMLGLQSRGAGSGEVGHQS